MKRNFVIAAFIVVVAVVALIGFNPSFGSGSVTSTTDFINEEGTKNWGVNYTVEYLNEDGRMLGRESHVHMGGDTQDFNYSEQADKLRVIVNFVNANEQAFYNERSGIGYRSIGSVKSPCEQEGDFKSSGKFVLNCEVKKEFGLRFISRNENSRQTNEVFFKKVKE